MAIKFPRRKKDNKTAPAQEVQTVPVDSEDAIDGGLESYNTSQNGERIAKEGRVHNPNLLSKPINAKNKMINLLGDKWAVLPSRDKAALIILTVFIVITVGGYGGYAVHKAATEQQDTYQTAINDYFWLRSQSANIDPTQGGEQSASVDQQLNQMLSQAGVDSAQVLKVGDDAQISFMHPNQAIASNILSAIVNNGYQIKQLTMQQNPEDKVIRVQATVGQAGG